MKVPCPISVPPSSYVCGGSTHKLSPLCPPRAVPDQAPPRSDESSSPICFCGRSVIGCSAGTKTPSSPSNPTPPSNPPPATVSVSVAPTTANIRAGTTFAFSSSVDGSSNTAVTWAVNSVAGGNTTLGTIDVSGNYTAPAAVPNPNTITVTATSAADTTKTANSAVTLWNPTPTLTGISPASTNLGVFTLTITGTNLFLARRSCSIMRR